jgi:hypothetical protein
MGKHIAKRNKYKYAGGGFKDKVKKVAKIAIPAALAAAALYTGSKYITPNSNSSLANFIHQGQKGMEMSKLKTMLDHTDHRFTPSDAEKFVIASNAMGDRGIMRRGAIDLAKRLGMGIKKSKLKKLLRGRGISDKVKKGLAIGLPLAATAALALATNKYSNSNAQPQTYLTPMTRWGEFLSNDNKFYDKIAELRKMGGMGGGKLRGRGISDKVKKGLAIGLPLAAAAALAVGAAKYGGQSLNNITNSSSSYTSPITNYNQLFQDNSTLSERTIGSLFGYGIKKRS